MTQLSFYRTLLGAKWQDRPGRHRQIETVRKKRLLRILSVAKRNVPFQKRRLGKHTADEFSKIVPTDKEQMLANFVDTADENALRRFQISRGELSRLAAAPKGNDAWFKARMLLSTTSGTTGTTGVVLNSRSSWANQRAAVFSRTCRGAIPLTQFNPLRPYRMAFVLIQCPHSVSYRAVVDSTKSNSAFTKIRCFTIEDSTDQLLKELAQYRPQFLQSYPNYLELFARKQLDGKGMGLRPEVISSIGDLLSDEQRRLLNEAFPDAQIVNQYGATECLPIANTCQRGKLHLNSDFVILEPVDQNDQPVAAGEFSKHVLLTNLLNDFQPLIRYRLKDTVRLIETPCECGSPLPVLEIQGRCFPFLHVTNNSGQPCEIEGAIVLSAMMKQTDISKFHIAHHRRNEIDVNVVLNSQQMAEPATERARRLANFQSALTELTIANECEQSVKFKINFVENNQERPSSHKRKMFDTTVRAA